jgi:serine-type D-Ala-D-Ala carboxypeptidase/endopeptidase (penicillin-binding protein 4)
MNRQRYTLTAPHFFELLAGVVGAVILTAALVPATQAVEAATGDAVSGPAKLVKTIAAIEDQARYRHADWGIQVLNEGGGKVLASQNSQKLFVPASTMKIYSVATALKLYGPNYRFKTPVYPEGAITGGTLDGNLILVASGDTSMGLRELPNGTLFTRTDR